MEDHWRWFRIVWWSLAGAGLAFLGIKDGILLRVLSTPRRLGNLHATGKEAVLLGLAFLILSAGCFYMASRAYRFEDLEEE